MRIWFDTEFIEDGRTIDLMSIGMVREDGKTLYLENAECEIERASPWVVENVVPHLKYVGHGKHYLAMSRGEIAHEVLAFAGEKPEFWAYYADYDWVALCQLYGTMMQLPKGWPMYCNDVKQLCNSVGNPPLTKQVASMHNSLADALWAKQAWEYLQEWKRL